jgi:hypothetical protein
MSLLLTRQDVANELRVSVKTVDRLIIQPCLGSLSVLARAFELSLSEFLYSF